MTDTWNDNNIQFARLISEIESAGGFTNKLIKDLCINMDLEQAELISLIDRGQSTWDRIKGETI